MFNREDVVKAVEIQKLGYAFLMYVTDKIDKNEFTFSRIHDDEGSAEVFFSWINDYYDYLPTSILPNKDELQGFSNYFASYLTTSFILTEEPERINNRNECNCDICMQFVNLSHLKSISPKNFDREIAAEKRLEIVKELALFYGIELSTSQCKDIADDELNIRDVAYLAYTKSLFQRIQFSEGGVYILALWRQFAWSVEGKPIKDFELSAVDILDAMNRMRIKLECFNVESTPER